MTLLGRVALFIAALLSLFIAIIIVDRTTATYVVNGVAVGVIHTRYRIDKHGICYITHMDKVVSIVPCSDIQPLDPVVIPRQ